ncbi:hypothetical protein WDU94_010371, partial [Cyamophila willieti]
LEYCDGGDLSSLIKSSGTKLSEFQVQRFVRQLVLALKYLREHNVCHLDLKPQNILIKNNRLKLGGKEIKLIKYQNDRSTWYHTCDAGFSWRLLDLVVMLMGVGAIRPTP